MAVPLVVELTLLENPRAAAIEAYRARELELTLEEAYEEDAEEAEHLNQEWSRVDSELGD